ncbi:coenzyme F420-0:L-glutamate ligase [Phytoactinopolyspora alkaliphila]|uniref:Coenzyme F420-0:L-glutamate ligase n=1 Tax=Phytoactinopolyspora alkaliphila TaxID=1783498 RepID=A0A6N9YQA9_9ACTN|nr:coenzyme F420-0:L-glutamate ligase [Phytoactinopolyspora alkaliphila]NED97162.1 coenzyme F420-0:L-glutamate ligase [Phytoactinopolyspora alkaliphila]
MSPPARFEVWGIPGLPEVRPGDDLAGLVAAALHDAATSGDDAGAGLADGDILVVTSKIVSKAEGRIRTGVDRDEAIDAEAVRTVSEWATPRGRTRVVETRHGFVMAAAGVDASNVTPGTIVLLPEDPDTSARRLRDGIRNRLGVRVGVIVTDTAGRVWRNGVVDLAIGAAGVVTLDDLRGRADPYGNDLGVTMVAVADEIAGATELVRTKLSGVPVAVVRGLSHLVLPLTGAAGAQAGTGGGGIPDPGASVLVRPSAEDRFRLGTPESMREAVANRRTVRSFTADPVDPAMIRRAIGAALTAPSPGAADQPPVRFVILESDSARTSLAAALAGRQPAGATEPALPAAACVVIPCLANDDAAARDRMGSNAVFQADADPAMILAAGAAVENMLIALAADGLGAVWIFPDPALTDAASATLDLPPGWMPVGAVAVGRPAAPGAAHPALPVDEFTIER